MSPPDKTNQPEDRSLVPRPSGELARAGEEVKSGELVKRGLRDLEKGAGPKLLHALEGHEDQVWSVTWSPDGSKIASGSRDYTVKVWDAGSGKEIYKLEGHDYWVKSVAWSPDGNKIASGSQDCTIRVWDAASGKEISKAGRPPEALGTWVWSVTWSPDGSKLASGGQGCTIRVWDAASGKELQTFEGYVDPSLNSGGKVITTSVSWSPDGSKLANSGYDAMVRVWDIASGKELQTFEGHESPYVWSVAWSPDGSKLASGGGGSTIRLWDVTSGKEIQKLDHRSARSVAWSPDGSRLASGHWGGTVRVWDAASGKELYKLEGLESSFQPRDGETGYVSSVAWSPDGSKLASSGSDEAIKIWSIPR